MTQTSEFATQLGRSPNWWLLAAKKAMYLYAATWYGSRTEEPAERDLIRLEAGQTLQARLAYLLELAEHSTSGEAGDG